MTNTADLIVQIHPDAEDDRRDLLRMTDRLRKALHDLDVASITDLPGPPAPPDTKGAGLPESLVVKLGMVGLGKLIGVVRDWATRSDRAVRLTVDGDTIEVGRPTTAQQEQLIGTWLARHAPRG